MPLLGRNAPAALERRVAPPGSTYP